MNTAFQRIIIIGYGKATGEILRFVHAKKAAYGYALEFIEHERNPFSITEKICGEKGIPFARIPDKKELGERFAAIEDNTLIISASNNFLFPASVVEKKNITIINFHNALLPRYPGRNAPTWVIYEGERETGVTWHYVTAGVDEGNIIIQKKCRIEPEMRAYELTEKLMDLACEGFAECFDAVLAQTAEARPQGFDAGRRMYRSHEMPADGFFALSEEPEKIYRLLRSVDYGKSPIFPPVKTIVDGREAEVLRYRRIITPDKREDKDGFLYLPLDEEHLLKIKYRTGQEA